MLLLLSWFHWGGEIRVQSEKPMKKYQRNLKKKPEKQEGV